MSYVLRALSLFPRPSSTVRAAIVFFGFGTICALSCYFVCPVAAQNLEDKTAAQATHQNVEVQTNVGPSAPRTPTDRRITPAQAAALKANIPMGASVGVAPLEPGEPNRFAHELAQALREAGARVPVLPLETSTMFANGQNGLLVTFSHADWTCRRVFEALQSAHLHPIDLGDMPLHKGVFIRVGPIANQTD
jgi:hypothetical protein